MHLAGEYLAATGVAGVRSLLITSVSVQSCVPGHHHERVPYRMALAHDDDQSGDSLPDTS